MFPDEPDFTLHVSHRPYRVTVLGLWSIFTDGSYPPPNRFMRMLIWLHPFFAFEWED